MYKRRFVPVFRDFPEGCGVFSGHKSNSGESLIQSNFKGIIRAHRDFPNHSETKNLRIDGFDNLSDIIGNDESNGVVIDHEEKEVTGPNQSTSSEKKRRMSSHNSTMKVQTNTLVITEKLVIVSGLAASSKCPWSQPKKRGRR